ncbi:MAG: hypothetical protein DRH97_07730, partial [Chloroflexi bacterium]
DRVAEKICIWSFAKSFIEISRMRRGIMDQWKKTTCVLCVNFCGLEVLVENNQIMKARGGR